MGQISTRPPPEIRELLRRHRARQREWEAEESRRGWLELRPLLTPSQVAMLSQPVVITPSPQTQPTEENILEEIHDSVNQILDWTKEKAPEPKPPGSLLSTEEAAAYLGLSPESVRRLCRRRAVTFIQAMPSEYRFHLDDLVEYVNSRRHRRKSVFNGPG
jgi:excisionase family DNA binding protein